MFSFFEQIGGFLTVIVDFVVMLFEQLVNFFKIMAASLSFVVQVVGYLPGPIQGGCLCIIGVSIIYLVINR